MDKQYTINWGEKSTTKTGKAVFNVELEGVDGKVSIWGDFPNFANLMPGTKVTGNLYTNDKGYKTLYPPKPSTTNPTKNFAGNMMKEKAKSIEKSQDRKEEGIKTSSTIRMAVDLAIAEEKPDRENIQKWRDWLVKNWDIDEPTSPLDINEPPF